MTTDVTLPWIAVAGVFLAGICVGWLVAKGAGVRLSLGNWDRRQDPESRPTVGLVAKRRTFSVTLNCRCGAVWKFAEGTEPLPPGTEPLPPGDSFTCPKCGGSLDLQAARDAGAQALAQLQANKGRI